MAQHLDAMVLELNPLMPAEAFYYFPRDNEIRTGNGLKALRRIFQGQIEFDEFERNHIQKMREYLSKHKVTIPNWWEDGHILRFLYANQFKYEKAYKTIKSHTEWREKTLPIDYSNEIEAYLKKGVFYMHGRDDRFRPIIFIDVSKINAKEAKIEEILQSMTYFFEFILKFTMLPGQIENWVVVLDLNKIGVSSLPISALKSVMGYLSSNYRSRMFATYVINTPSSIFIPWNIIKGFLEETTIQKISFNKDGNPKKLFTHTHLSQVETKFGGTAPNTTNYWPPSEISKQYQNKEGEELSKLLISQNEYYTLWENGKLKKNIVCYNYLQSRHNKVPMNQIHINDMEQSVINLSSSAIPSNNLLQQNNEINKSQFFRVDSAPKSQYMRPKQMSDSISCYLKSSIKQQNEQNNSNEIDKQQQSTKALDPIPFNKIQDCNNFLDQLNKRDSLQNSPERTKANLSSTAIKLSTQTQNQEDIINEKDKAFQQGLNLSMQRISVVENRKSIQFNQQIKFYQSLNSQELPRKITDIKEKSQNNYDVEAIQEVDQSLSISAFMDIPFERQETFEFNQIRNIRTNARNGKSIMSALNCIVNYGKNA